MFPWKSRHRMDILATELWMTNVWKVKGGMEPLRVSLIWNGVVKLSRLQKTFWAFQMGDDPMTLQIPYGHSCHWGMGGHCLEARARVGLRISEYPWCEMVWSKYYTSRKRFEHSQWEMTFQIPDKTLLTELYVITVWKGNGRIKTLGVSMVLSMVWSSCYT